MRLSSLCVPLVTVTTSLAPLPRDDPTPATSERGSIKEESRAQLLDIENRSIRTTATKSAKSVPLTTGMRHGSCVECISFLCIEQHHNKLFCDQS
mmetsp:Transcript_1528/g.3864  ORF Transcript_1528/g.3864 Transcript_1528/m.3864 type:complete len:95 (-) Transcript_1528:188-472(-)